MTALDLKRLITWKKNTILSEVLFLKLEVLNRFFIWGRIVLSKRDLLNILIGEAHPYEAEVSKLDKMFDLNSLNYSWNLVVYQAKLT